MYLDSGRMKRFTQSSFQKLQQHHGANIIYTHIYCTALRLSNYNMDSVAIFDLWSNTEITYFFLPHRDVSHFVKFALFSHLPLDSLNDQKIWMVVDKIKSYPYHKDYTN